MSLYCNEEFRVKHQLPPLLFPENIYCGIKDLQNKIVAMNEKTAHLLGYYSAKDMLSSQSVADYEIRCRARELAETFMEEDKIIYNDESAVTLTQCFYKDNEKKLFLSEKTPFKNAEGEIIGMFCVNIDITASRVVNVRPLLAGASITNTLKKQFSIIIKPSYPNIKLSKRQTECLYFIINGYSSSKIAEFCHLSKRTVETYIEQLKDKLLCVSKQELIEKAINLGYLEMIPQVIFDKFAK